MPQVLKQTGVFSAATCNPKVYVLVLPNWDFFERSLSFRQTERQF